MADDAVTVGALAATLGVSVRTLHHWDAIGVVAPSARTSGGYRTYQAADVARARRVLLLRDLGVPLADIPGHLTATAAERTAELVRRQQELAARIARLREVEAELAAVIVAEQHGTTLSADEADAAFGRGWDPAWGEAARERWGDSPQWAEHAERSAARGTADWAEIVGATREVLRDMARARGAGVAPDDDAALALAERHRAAMSAHFHVTPSMHVLMGRLFRTEPGFADAFEEVQEGLTGWLGDAIDAAARVHGIDPATARWE